MSNEGSLYFRKLVLEFILIIRALGIWMKTVCFSTILFYLLFFGIAVSADSALSAATASGGGTVFSDSRQRARARSRSSRRPRHNEQNIILCECPSRDQVQKL